MLTVLITTYNGALTLPEVLGAYGRLEPPAGGWKLIVVDNDSSDATPEILESFRDRLPLQALRQVRRQVRRGQNAARNTGLPHLEGDLAVLSDDDAVPSPQAAREAGVVDRQLEAEDLAPTIAALLDVTLDGVDGKPARELLDVFTAPRRESKSA